MILTAAQLQILATELTDYLHEDFLQLSKFFDTPVANTTGFK